MSKIQWVLIAVIVFFAVLHYSEVLVLPLNLLITILGISLIISTAISLFKSYKKKT